MKEENKKIIADATNEIYALLENINAQISAIEDTNEAEEFVARYDALMGELFDLTDELYGETEN